MPPLESACYHTRWQHADPISEHLKIFLRYFLVFLTPPNFVNKCKFSDYSKPLLDVVATKLWRTLSVIHVLQAYSVYFLNSFVCIPLFPHFFFISRWLNLKRRFFKMFSGQCLISQKCIFLGYLNPHRASRWLILKLISMLWQ